MPRKGIPMVRELLCWEGMEALHRFLAVRRRTEEICEPLAPDDFGVQTMTDVSPPKWHLAHTSWFFEEFLLARRPGYRRFDEAFGYVFNSYYESVGERVERGKRGLLSRPALDEVEEYRTAVTDGVRTLIEEG